MAVDHRSLPSSSMPGQPGERTGLFCLGPLSVATFNARGLTARYKRLNLCQDLSNHHIDLCCLQETKTKDDSDFFLETYRFIFFPAGNKNYGLGFAISERLERWLTRHWAVDDRVAVVSFRFPLRNHGRVDLHVLCCYGPTSALTAKDPSQCDAFFESISATVRSLRNAHSVILLGGDFNAKAGVRLRGERAVGSFGRGYRNANGDHLLHFAEHEDFLLANTCFQHQHRHRTTWEGIWANREKKIYNQIDYILIPQKVRSSLRQARSYAGILADSDHRLVVCTFDLGQLRVIWKATVDTSRRRVVTKDLKANKEAFQKHVARYLADRSSQLDLPLLNNLLESAAVDTVGIAHCAPRPNINYVQDLSLRQKKIRDQIRSTKDPDTLRLLRAERQILMKDIHRRTRQAALQRIDDHVKQIEEVKDDARMFQAVQLLRSSTRSSVVVKDSENKIISNPLEKANAVATFFQSLLYDPTQISLPPFLGPPRPLLLPVSPAEIALSLKKMRNGRAPGPDEVPVEFYKYAGDVVPSILAKLINETFEKHEVIDVNSGIICPVPKPGKPKGPCSNLRPITLLNVSRKVLSLTLLHRIQSKLEPVIPNYQSGFRPGRSTTDIIWAKRWLISMVVTFDVEIHLLGIDLTRAFGTIDRPLLLTRLSAVPKMTEDEIRMSRLLLAETSLTVKVGKERSTPFVANVGSPEGDGLSPSMFTFYLSEAVRDADSAVPRVIHPPDLDQKLQLPTISAYADDVDLYSTSDVYLEQKLTHYVGVFAKWKLELNTIKTERIHIVVKKPTDNCPVCNKPCRTEALQCDGCDSWVHFRCSSIAEVDLQQMMQDPRSTFMCRNCVDNIPDTDYDAWKTSKSLGSLLSDREDLVRRCQLAAVALKQHYKIWPRRHFISLKTRIRIYNSFVLPVLTYNLAACALSPFLADKLDAFHRKQLRLVTGTLWPERVTNSELYKMTGTCPISSLARLRRWIFFGHVCRLPADAPAKMAMRSFFLASSFLRRRRGRPASCLQKVLAADLEKSFSQHHRKLEMLSDLTALERLAQTREDWMRFVHTVCDGWS